jgi:hypothetical protein
MAIAFESDKVMFEIYKDPTYSGKYQVVYFTELNDANREAEFNRAMRGEHLYDGFLRNFGKEEGKKVIADLIERLNRGESLGEADIETALEPFKP